MNAMATASRSNGVAGSSGATAPAKAQWPASTALPVLPPTSSFAAPWPVQISMVTRPSRLPGM